MLGKTYLLGKDVPKDKEKAYQYLVLSAMQGNTYAAYFLEHFNDKIHPDLLLMATRLMHHLEHIIEGDINNRGKNSGGGIDRKLAQKIKRKKVGQGHTEDDHGMREQLL